VTTGLFASVSGVRANQTRINVVSNNVANVNTNGFKSSLVNFATVFSNTVSGGGAPTGTLGGTNPKQIGTGVLVSEIASNFSQGGTQFTGKNTDMMINGSGFFAIERPDITQ
jgi:flagellar hook protein FlgE